MPVILGLFFRWTTFLLRVCYESPRVLINVTPGCAQNSSEGFLSKCVSEDIRVLLGRQALNSCLKDFPCITPLRPTTPHLK